MSSEGIVPTSSATARRPRRRKTQRDLSTSIKIEEAINVSSIIHPASKTPLIRAVQLFYSPELAQELVELYRRLEEDASTFDEAYRDFLRMASGLHLRERYRLRLETLKTQHDVQPQVIEILKDLEGQLLGSVVTLELLAEGEERKLTVDELVRRFERSALPMASDPLRKAVEERSSRSVPMTPWAGRDADRTARARRYPSAQGAAPAGKQHDRSGS